MLCKSIYIYTSENDISLIEKHILIAIFYSDKIFHDIFSFLFTFLSTVVLFNLEDRAET